MKIAVPDLISNSYFPTVAAAELGLFKEEGVSAEVRLIFPVDRAYRALRDGEVDVVAGSAHSALSAFPEWKGVKLLCAQGQGMYWFLVMRADLKPRRGDLSAVKGRKLGAAPWVDMGLKQLLASAGIDLVRDEVAIAPVPGAVGSAVNFGLTAAKALEDGLIDGFWANGMAAEIAVRSGVGVVVIDARRGDGPDACFNYTMASLATTDEKIEKDKEAIEAIVRGLIRSQQALSREPDVARKIGERVFPAYEASLIADLVRRDALYYSPEISKVFVEGMNVFCRNAGILTGNPAYNDVVARQVIPLWHEARR
jgi:ABC-type nitrate/sulfonate/bicarbonate transport system substrate-binding protein